MRKRFARSGSNAVWLSSLVLLAIAPGAALGEGDENVRQTVARISFVSGEVSYSRGDDPDAWDKAIPNVPMIQGDRLWAGSKGQAELQLAAGGVFLGAGTGLAALSLTHGVSQFSLDSGAATFRVNRLGRGEVFEVDTPNAAVTFLAPGTYRIDVDGEGGTLVAVWYGSARALVGAGQCFETGLTH